MLFDAIWDTSQNQKQSQSQSQTVRAHPIREQTASFKMCLEHTINLLTL